jgi:hypothetical protein
MGLREKTYDDSADDSGNDTGKQRRARSLGYTEAKRQGNKKYDEAREGIFSKFGGH